MFFSKILWFYLYRSCPFLITVILRCFTSFIFKPITIWLLPINLNSLVTKKKEGSSRNHWKDIEETHRIKSRELSFRKRRQGWYQGWWDSWVETPMHLSGSLSLSMACLSSLPLCVFWPHLFPLSKRNEDVFAHLSQIVRSWANDPETYETMLAPPYSQKQKCKWKQHWNIISQLSY